MSTHLGGKLERLGSHIHRYNAHSRGGGKNLDSHVPETADTDNHASSARNQSITAELDRMIGSETGICQRRSLRHIKIADGYQLGSRNGEVFGHSSVATDSNASDRFDSAFIITSAKTSGTPATADDAVDRDCVPLCPPRDTRPECFDPAGILVPERHRSGATRTLRSIDDVKIRAARSCSADSDQDLAGARIRLWYGRQFGFIG